MLRELYAVLDEFLAIKRKYDLEPSQVEQTMQLLLGDGDTSQMRQRLLPSRADTAAASSRRARRLRWALWDKMTAQRMVERLAQPSEEAHPDCVWWPIPFLQTWAQLPRLNEDSDTATFGLLAGVPPGRLLVLDAEQSARVLKDLDTPRDTFHPQSSFANFTIGTPVTAIVEYKHYNPSPDGSNHSAHPPAFTLPSHPVGPTFASPRLPHIFP